MIRRLAVLLTLAGIGWVLYTRLRPRPMSDEEDFWFDDQPGRAPERATGVDAVDAVPVIEDAAQASAERIRTLTGSVADTTPATEQVAPSGDGPQASEPAGAAGDADSPAATAPVTATAGEIKGNVRSDGEKIYHMPGDPTYERTKAEQTFATVEEAEAAGFRRAGHRPE
jgi:hypothetical protein